MAEWEAFDEVEPQWEATKVRESRREKKAQAALEQRQRAFSRSGMATLADMEAMTNVRLVVLTGTPGSGKSTLAALLCRRGWVVASQDELRSRKKVEALCSEALATDHRVVVDRCNQTVQHREVWWGLLDRARLARTSALTVWLDVPVKECGRRIMARKNHPTLPPNQASLLILDGFVRKFEAPRNSEQVRVWRESGISIDVADLAARIDAAFPAHLRDPPKTTTPPQPPSSPVGETADVHLAPHHERRPSQEEQQPDPVTTRATPIAEAAPTTTRTTTTTTADKKPASTHFFDEDEQPPAEGQPVFPSRDEPTRSFVDDAAVARLAEMGFDDAAVASAALRDALGDEQTAIEVLLSAAESRKLAGLDGGRPLPS